MALITDVVVASIVTGSLGLATVITPLYIKNRRALKKEGLPAEDFIERFMKRQEQEIEHKNILIQEMERTVKHQEETIRKLETTVYKKDALIRDLKRLLKELRLEIQKVKRQTVNSKLQLDKMKKEYKDIKK